MKDVFKSPYHAIWNLCNTSDYFAHNAVAQNYLFECGEDAIKPLMNALWYPEDYVAGWYEKGTLRTDPLYSLQRKEHIDSYIRRQEIARVLTNLGKPAVPYLISTLFHAEEYFLRQWVANILRNIGDSSATIPVLVAMLEDRNTPRRQVYASIETFFLSLKPFFLPFQWWLDPYLDIGDLLTIYDRTGYNSDDLINSPHEQLRNLLPSWLSIPNYTEQIPQIMEDCFSNKVPIDDIETHIQNCLILSEELRPIYVLTVMHHNNFNLKEALAHYDANRHLHTSG